MIKAVRSSWDNEKNLHLCSTLSIQLAQRTILSTRQSTHLWRSISSLPLTKVSVPSLVRMQRQFEHEGNRLGSIYALKEWGRTLRNESRFEEALHIHSEGLRQAEALGDTLEWIQALNDIYTDYHRMGVLDVAQEYHYKARTLSEAYSDTTYLAKKNRVISLNGLGNIYMTFGNYEQAEQAFRLALAGEQALSESTEHTKPSTPLPQSWNRRLLRARSKRREPTRLTSSVRGTNLAGSLYSLVSLG